MSTKQFTFPSASFTGAIAGNVLTTTAVTGTILYAGVAATSFLAGEGVPSGLWVIDQIAGVTGGAGTYHVNKTLNTAITAEAMTQGGAVTAGTTGAASNQVSAGSELKTIQITHNAASSGSADVYVQASLDGGKTWATQTTLALSGASDSKSYTATDVFDTWRLSIKGVTGTTNVGGFIRHKHLYY